VPGSAARRRSAPLRASPALQCNRGKKTLQYYIVCSRILVNSSTCDATIAIRLYVPHRIAAAAARRDAPPPCRRAAAPPCRQAAVPPPRRAAVPPRRRAAAPPRRHAATPPRRRAAAPGRAAPRRAAPRRSSPLRTAPALQCKCCKKTLQDYIQCLKLYPYVFNQGRRNYCNLVICPASNCRRPAAPRRAAGPPRRRAGQQAKRTLSMISRAAVIFLLSPLEF
jgi:hypothetical protein